MNKKSTVISLAALVSFTCLAQPELKGSPQELKQFLHPEARVMTISGKGHEVAYSDIAIVSLIITTEEKKLSQALEKNSALRQQVTNSLVASGVNPDNINSSKFSSSPQYGWFGSKPSSYEVVNRMAIKIDDEKHLKQIALQADENEQLQIGETQFEHSKKAEFEQVVKTKALEDVLDQKAFYEKKLGLKLEAISFRDSDVTQSGTDGAMEVEKIVVTGSRVKDSNSRLYDSYSYSSEVSSFDEVEYTVNVSVDFKIVSAEQD